MRQDVGVDGDAQRLSQLCWMFFLKIIDDQDQQLEVMQDGYRSPIPPKLQWRTWAADPEGITGDGCWLCQQRAVPPLKACPIRQASGGVVVACSRSYNYMKSGVMGRCQQDQRVT